MLRLSFVTQNLNSKRLNVDEKVCDGSMAKQTEARSVHEGISKRDWESLAENERDDSKHIPF